MLLSVLRNIFHHNSFRPGQLEAVMQVAHGKDVFVRLPTGGGKSVCMFLVPLAMGGEAMGIVISPLIGLIDQQVKQLELYGILIILMLNNRLLSSIQLECLLFMAEITGTLKR